jgi:NAD(P)-dependent dehydrogenase (short-subunit alcohol dehydrogenase family)
MMGGWTAKHIPDQTGRLAVVTGANTGIGLQTALGLARAGAEVVMTVRDMAKGEDARSQIRAACPSARVRLDRLDLADLKSIADFATRMLEGQTAVDMLINNAGVATPRHRLTTRDGFELQFGVNFLGHFRPNCSVATAAAKRYDPRDQSFKRYAPLWQD